jgi:NADPH:quinone reductase
VRSIRYHRPEGFRLDEVPEPEPGPGQVLVRAEAIGVTLPAVRKGAGGGEVAGRVIAVGPGVTGYAIGDRVTGLPFEDAYADVVALPTFTTSMIPGDASFVQAVGLVRSGHVALAALATADLGDTESVCITGAAGGVGHLAVQLAKLQGVKRVVAAVGSPAKASFVAGLGADEVVTYDDATWGEPVDVVLDAVGGELLPRAVAAVRPGGRLIFFNSGGGTVPAFDLLAGSKTVTGMTMARFAATRRELYDDHGERLWHLHHTGQLHVAIHARLPLTAAAEAHRIIEARANRGKVVLVP